MIADKRLESLQRVRVGLVAALGELDKEIKEMELQQAPRQPRQRANLKKDRVNKYAQRYALK